MCWHGRRWLLLLGAGIVCLGDLSVWAEEAPPQQQQQVQPRHGFRVAQPEMLPLPGFYMLRMENVQKELNLTPEQLAQLTELSKAYSEQVRADQEIWKNWQKMTPEERSAKTAEQRQRYAQRVQDVRQQVEKILQPSQLKTLQQIVLRTQGWWVLYQPQIQETLGLSQEQKQQLADIRQKMFEELQEVQKRAFERAYAVLQKEQQEKLLQEVQKRPH
ncbi:MAG TPA: Spy/CpxP family protein refolding chaperone [Thermoguttaceae bacterium]|nr:Spy/CpxP family protein refolding chaperone [Thermoguttaceae bacterium]HPP52769.1 Spy/CpxP family protein refolding chaperone [Thermoguttaceae bacterium]